MRPLIIKLSVIVLMLVAVVLSACGQASPSPTPGQQAGPAPTPGSQDDVEEISFTAVTPPQLKAMLESKDFLLVNVHIPYQGEIPGTDAFVPYNEIERNLSEFPEDRGAKIVLYCRSGSMSTKAANTLVGLGFTNVYSLEGGGFGDWETPDLEPVGSVPSSGQPRIEFDVESIDLGLVPIADVTNTRFAFRNTGDGPLEIADVRVYALEGC
jgi:rhodanese-related sulfurtransferase